MMSLPEATAPRCAAPRRPPQDEATTSPAAADRKGSATARDPRRASRARSHPASAAPARAIAEIIVGSVVATNVHEPARAVRVSARLGTHEWPSPADDGSDRRKGGQGEDEPRRRLAQRQTQVVAGEQWRAEQRGRRRSGRRESGDHRGAERPEQRTAALVSEPATRAFEVVVAETDCPMRTSAREASEAPGTMRTASRSRNHVRAPATPTGAKSTTQSTPAPEATDAHGGGRAAPASSSAAPTAAPSAEPKPPTTARATTSSERVASNAPGARPAGTQARYSIPATPASPPAAPSARFRRPPMSTPSPRA